MAADYTAWMNPDLEGVARNIVNAITGSSGGGGTSTLVGNVSFSDTTTELFGGGEDQTRADAIADYNVFKAANPTKRPLFIQWFASENATPCLSVTYNNT